jgi:hypothetical protein
MKLSIASISFYATTIAQSTAFTVSNSVPSTKTTNTETQIKVSSQSFYFLDEITPTPIDETAEIKPVIKKATIKPKAVAANHKQGLFSPLILAAKEVVGVEKLNKIRAQVIGYHTKVIKSFVDTNETVLGSTIVLQLFALMDMNEDGAVDEDELAIAFKTLGFSWLNEKKIAAIIKRSGSEDGLLRMEEFKQEFPKTLRTNLVKLAKKNGGDLGFLV